MLATEALQAVCKRSPADIGTTAHDQSCWLSTGMGVDDPDSVAFLHFVDRSDRRLVRSIASQILASQILVNLNSQSEYL